MPYFLKEIPFESIFWISDNHMQFLFRKNGSLYDSQSIQIDVKSEFKQALGRFILTFTNKSQHVFESFSVSSVDQNDLLRLTLMPIDSTVVHPNMQANQLVNVECVDDFQHIPQLVVQFRLKFIFVCFCLKNSCIFVCF
jgi:hypothetical protein